MTVHQNNVTAVKLQCQVVTDTTKPKITWLRDGEVIQPKKDVMKNQDCKHVSDGIYFFTEGSKQDVIICGHPLNHESFAGRYTCRAENEIGADEIHADLNILGEMNRVDILRRNCKFKTF